MPLVNSHLLVTALFLVQSIALPQNIPSVAKNICNDGELAAGNPRAAFFRKLVDGSDYKSHKRAPSPKDCPMKVGIVGGGVAGLYAGMLLDSLGIDYDIHEASDRIGGRVFTYRFDQEAWDKSTPSDPAYYDYYVNDLELSRRSGG
jgi:hypothetical protein